MLRIIIGLMIALCAKSLGFAQDNLLAEKAYIHVIKDGMSTAPDLVVVTVKDLNNGQTKEICTDVVSLFLSVELENNKEWDNQSYFLSKSASRTFNFRNDSALKRLNFNKYKLSHKREIESIIKKEHLRDSLKKMTKFQLYRSSEYERIYDIKGDILDSISGSISKVRPLTEDENKMLKNLNDQYQDDQYNNPDYKQTHKMSVECEQLLSLWNLKTLEYKKKLSTMDKESARMGYKFFRKYFNQYGLNFCHIAFKHGITTFIADETGIVTYGDVVN